MQQFFFVDCQPIPPLSDILTTRCINSSIPVLERRPRPFHTLGDDRIPLTEPPAYPGDIMVHRLHGPGGQHRQDSTCLVSLLRRIFVIQGPVTPAEAVPDALVGRCATLCRLQQSDDPGPIHSPSYPRSGGSVDSLGAPTLLGFQRCVESAQEVFVIDEIETGVRLRVAKPHPRLGSTPIVRSITVRLEVHPGHHPRDITRRQPTAGLRDSPKFSECKALTVLGERRFVEFAQPWKSRGMTSKQRGDGSLILRSEIRESAGPEGCDLGVACGIPKLCSRDPAQEHSDLTACHEVSVHGRGRPQATMKKSWLVPPSPQNPDSGVEVEIAQIQKKAV